jgi:hypothetical protein
MLTVGTWPRHCTCMEPQLTSSQVAMTCSNTTPVRLQPSMLTALTFPLICGVGSVVYEVAWCAALALVQSWLH